MEAPEPTPSTSLDKRVVIFGEAPVSIGRASSRVSERAAKSSNLCLTNSHISKEHARLLVQNNEVLIEDLNSSFGTIKNEDLLIPFNRIPLKEGDILGFVLNRSLSFISTMRNNRGLSKTVPLSIFLNPKIQIQFRVTKIDMSACTIVLERHSDPMGAIAKDYTLNADCCDTLVDEEIYQELNAEAAEESGSAGKKELSSMSFSNLLNSDSCQCTDVSDSNEPQCDSHNSRCRVESHFQLTNSEAEETTLSESENSANSMNGFSDDDSEILVNLGPDSDLNEDKSEDLVNLIELGKEDTNDTKVCDSEFNCGEESLVSGINESGTRSVYSSDEQEEVGELSEHSDDSENSELSEQNEVRDQIVRDQSFRDQSIRDQSVSDQSVSEQSDSEQSDSEQSDSEQSDSEQSDEVIELSDEDIESSSSVCNFIDVSSPSIVVDRSWEEKLEWCPVASKASYTAEFTYSRKRKHEEIEVTNSEKAAVPPAKKERLNGFLWEVGKGAMYVTGTLMALVAYGGYLVNSEV